MKKFNEAYTDCPKCTSENNWNIEYIDLKFLINGLNDKSEMKWTCNCCGFSYLTYSADYKDNIEGGKDE